VTGLAEPAARLRTLRYSVCMFLGCQTPTLAFLLGQRQILAREPPPSRGGGG